MRVACCCTDNCALQVPHVCDARLGLDFGLLNSILSAGLRLEAACLLACSLGVRLCLPLCTLQWQPYASVGASTGAVSSKPTRVLVYTCTYLVWAFL